MYKNNSKKDFILLKMIFYGWCICNIVLILNTYNPKYMSTLFENISWIEYIEKNGLNIIYFAYSIIFGN